MVPLTASETTKAIPIAANFNFIYLLLLKDVFVNAETETGCASPRPICTNERHTLKTARILGSARAVSDRTESTGPFDIECTNYFASCGLIRVRSNFGHFHISGVKLR